MDSKDVLIDGYGRIPQLLGMALDGLTAEQLAYRPTEQANSIAWLVWHLTRVQDKQVSDLAGREQAWIVDGWHARFDKPADLDRELNEPRWNPLPTVGVRLVSILSDNLQHTGQTLYLRGCIEDKHWYPA
jgi:hypothetical protein